MIFINMESDEIRELWNFVRDRKESILEYSEDFKLNFAEVRALMAACEKIEVAARNEEEGRLV